MAGYADVEDPVALLNRAPDTSGGPTIGDAIREAGFEVQAVNWVWEKVVGEDLVTSIIEPITGDFEKIAQQAGEWRNVKTRCRRCGTTSTPVWTSCNPVGRARPPTSSGT